MLYIKIYQNKILLRKNVGEKVQKMKLIIQELIAGFTVAIVALPLALAFGVAATGTPEGAVLGLYGAIFTGFFAALFGGTPGQVSGPTGPITVVITAVIIKYGIAYAFISTILAGIIQIFFGLLKLGRFIKYISKPVISGFMNGIALIIIMTQTSSVHDALLVVLMTIIIMIISSHITKSIPASLSALIVGTVAVLFLQPYLPHSHFYVPFLGEWSLVDKVNFIGNIPKGLPMVHIPHIDSSLLIKCIPPAFAIAILGAIDSLLTSVVMDNITGKKHNSNKELIGQGIGNMLAGLFGGMPGAGATVRSVINIKCGARTIVSGAFHSIVLLSFMLIFNKWVGQIPLAVLAGILIVTGFSMFDYDSLKKLKKPRAEEFIMLVTMILTVVVDLMVAVGVGVVLTFLHKKLFANSLKEKSMAK